MSYNPTLYYQLQRKLISKAIEELTFEEVIYCQQENQFYRLVINEAISYQFEARIGSWGNLWVKAESLHKQVDGERLDQFTIDQFFIEVQKICQMSDDTLTRYIEEAHQTIDGDLHLEKKYQSLDLSEVINFQFPQLDQLLPGHPKLIMNKGRIGFGVQDMQTFAPESAAKFHLRWVAVRKSKLIYSGTEWDFDNDFIIMPIHPWQWDRYVKVQYAQLIFDGDLLDLGVKGDFYTPLTSIRTLANASDPLKDDIKLSLSILNTSCYRGISYQYIKNGPAISLLMEQIVSNDEQLDSIRIQREKAAFAVKHPAYHQIEKAPYQYQELFAAVIRASVQSLLKDGEQALSVAALLLKTDQGNLVQGYINASAINAVEWVRAYFRVVVIPLYHLQLKYGLGVVAHGQNCVLILKNFIPFGLVLKDFHGDLRVSSNSELAEKASILGLSLLPAEHLIHDLITGHFISFLRYFSRLLDEEKILKECEFYSILAKELENYKVQSGFDHFDLRVRLDRKYFEKILINKVRFLAGYDGSSRPLPILGSMLKNPIGFTENLHEV